MDPDGPGYCAQLACIRLLVRDQKGRCETGQRLWLRDASRTTRNTRSPLFRSLRALENRSPSPGGVPALAALSGFYPRAAALRLYDLYDLAFMRITKNVPVIALAACLYQSAHRPTVDSLSLAPAGDGHGARGGNL